MRIDHYVTIDFDGIIQVTDDLGGVDVVVAETTSRGPYTFPAGVNHLDGDEARWYLGQRYGLPGGDFDRVRRQQQYLQAMFGKLFSSQTFTDPGRLDAALLAVTSAVTVDDTPRQRRPPVPRLLAAQRVARTTSTSSPRRCSAPARRAPASVVYLDTVACERMWTYLRSDSLRANAAEFSDEALPDVPR